MKTQNTLHHHAIQNSGLLKTWELHFSLVWVMELLVKVKFFLKTVTCQTQLTFNVSSMKTINELPVCVSDGLYTLFKKVFLLFHTVLLKCFIYSRVGILDSTWCNNLPLLLICLLPTRKKCNHIWKNHTYLNLVKSGHIQACKTSDLLFLSLFLVSSPPSTTTLRFPHSPLMNISPGKSNKLPIPFISIPCSSSSTVTTLFD